MRAFEFVCLDCGAQGDAELDEPSDCQHKRLGKVKVTKGDIQHGKEKETEEEDGCL